MKSQGKCFTFALVALGLSIMAVPAANACDSCGHSHTITQPAIVDTTLVEPAVVDTSVTMTQPIVNEVITQPAVSACDPCATSTVIMQPAVSACDPCASTVLTQPAVITQPSVILDEPRRHLLDLNTPLFRFGLF